MRPDLPPLNWLRSFECAARRRSFVQAAEELHLSSAAVSHHVRALEEWIGAPLFVRLAHGLKLTDMGEAYLTVVQDGLGQLIDGTHGLFGGDRREHVTIRASPSLTQLWLLPCLERFSATHPQIRLRLLTGIWPPSFSGDDVDIQVVYRRDDVTGLELRLLAAEHLFPVCTPELGATLVGKTVKAALADAGIISVVGVRDGWPQWLSLAANGVPAPEPKLETDLYLTAVQAARSGLGLALAPSLLVADCLARGELVAPFDGEVPCTESSTLAIPAQVAGRRTVKAVADWLLAEAQGTPTRLHHRH